MTEPILNAADAVAALGALPVPVGPEPQPLSAAEVRLEQYGDERKAYGNGSERALHGIALSLRKQLSDVRAYEQRLREQHDLDVAAINQLRARVASLELERRSTNEALDDAVQALRTRREGEPVEAPYVSRLLPPRDAMCARPDCGHSGEEHHHGDTKCWAHLPRTRGEFGVMSPVTICGCSGFVAAPSVEVSADRLTALLAPTQAHREDEPEAPHPAPCRWPSSPDCTCLEDGVE